MGAIVGYLFRARAEACDRNDDLDPDFGFAFADLPDQSGAIVQQAFDA
jgi:hypothetical protein